MHTFNHSQRSVHPADVLDSIMLVLIRLDRFRFFHVFARHCRALKDLAMLDYQEPGKVDTWAKLQ